MILKTLWSQKTKPAFVLFLVFGIILQAGLLVLICKYPRRPRFSAADYQSIHPNIPCENFLNKWDTENPVLLIDFNFLEKLVDQNCRWDEKRRVKIGVHVEYKNDKSQFDTNRFDLVFYDGPDNKDFLVFYEDGKRVIPKRFETRQFGNFEIPINITRFIEFYKRSKFVECLGLEMNRDEGDEVYQDGPTSTNILARFRDELIDNGMYPYFTGGTLLGWYRECTVIPHTYDMDLAVFKENYNPEYAEKVLRDETDFKLARKFGKLEDSQEITVFSKAEGRPAIDLFVMYDYVENGTLIYRYIPGLDSDGTKYRFSHLLLDYSCAADLHDHIFWVPCNPIEQLKHEFGGLWYRDHPTNQFGWNSSGKNVKKAGTFTKEELKKYYLTY